MFNLNDYRVRDLDEVVYHDYKAGEPLDLEKLKYAFFRFGKKCWGAITKSQDGNEFEVALSSSVIQDKKVFGPKTGILIESVDLNALYENFVLLDYIGTKKGFFAKKNADIVQAHALLSNIESVLAGKPAAYNASEIVSPEDYAKAMSKAKKAYDKDQESTIDSQTPEYDC